ncbi:hypothetical protein Vi05172_g12115 [Venturia inaequalis]|nr:hypothetical protein Vi05172_g12115 [Venturia inaequalis]
MDHEQRMWQKLVVKDIFRYLSTVCVRSVKRRVEMTSFDDSGDMGDWQFGSTVWLNWRTGKSAPSRLAEPASSRF